MSGLDDFKALLEEYRKLSLWAAGGSVALPFIASFIGVIPPWPAGLNVITAVFQLAALILVFQVYSTTRKSIVTKSIVTLFIAIFFIISTYLVLFSMFTIYVPETKRAIVVGYECAPNAQLIFRDDCPFLQLDQLASASYDEFLLWTKPSIAIVRAILVAFWFLFFICLAGLIGIFLVFQMRSKGRRKSPSKVV